MTHQKLLEEISVLKQRIRELEKSGSELRRVEEEVKLYSQRLAAFHETGLSLTSELNLELLLESIAQRALKLIGGASCNCYLYNPQTDLLERVVTAGTTLIPSKKTRQRGEGMIGQVWEKGTALLVNDYRSWSGRTRAYDSLPSRALVAAPFHFGTEFLGVLNIMAPLPHQYTRADVEMLSLFATQAAIAIRNARLFDRMNVELAERKRVEEALRESEEKYRLLIENTTEAVYVLQDGVFRYANRICGVMLGIPVDKLIGTSMLEFLNPADREKAVSQHIRILRGELASGRSEFRVLTRHGGERWAHVNSVGITWEGRTATLNFATDITDRKRVDEELTRSEEKFRKFFYTSPDAVNINRLEDGLYISINPGFTKVTGYTEEEIIGKTSIEFNIWGNIEDRQRLVTGLRKDGEVSNLEATFRMKGGELRYGLMSASLITLDGVTHILSITRDITDRRLAEEENRRLVERLQRSEKMEALGQLAGGVAHDLNNVLGILSGYSELLLMEIPEESRSRGHIEKILQSTEKGAAIIQDLLTLARRGVTASDVINLNDIVSEFLKTPVFEKMKDYHPGVVFRTEFDRNLLNIKGSPVHLEKTLMNLVSNAAESISGEGEVTIRTESRYLDKAIRGYDEVREGDYAVLTVSDTGMGIPAKNRDKIFEPFYTKKTMGRSGTGLGLAIVWGTVKDHNGHIDLQTEVGEGSTFTLYFPATREQLTAPQGKEPIDQYMGRGESVLVVDDIAEQRDVASELLTRLGYKVDKVSGGEEALEHLKEKGADILVLDMIMAPGIDGLETFRRVLEINPQQKAILVSGFSQTERVREAQRLGAGAYVKKPYVMEKIGVAIRDELFGK